MINITAFGATFDVCLEKLYKVLQRCIEKGLVLNWEKYCHFIVSHELCWGM